MGKKKRIKGLENKIEALEERLEKQESDKKQEKRWGWLWKIAPVVISVLAIYQTGKNYGIDYKPQLRINLSSYGMTWNEDGETLDEDDFVYQEVSRHSYDIQVDAYPMISVINIAAKPAKDIVIAWKDEENISSISEELNKGNSDTSVYLEDGLFVIQRNHEKKQYIQANTIQEINYLSSGSFQGTGYISIPSTYYNLIRDIVRTNIDYKWSLALKLSCTCKDSRDKEHNYDIELVFSPNYCYGYNNEVVDGKNGCVLEIKANIKEEK